jgi:hypothetical protein
MNTLNKSLLFINIIYIFLIVSGNVYGVGEKTVLFGGDSTWSFAENRTGITEVNSIRPYPVLILSKPSTDYYAATGVLGNFNALTGTTYDMSVSFDESSPDYFRDSTGNYKISVSPEVEVVDRRFARSGAGAVLFNGSGADNPIVIEPHSRDALFAPGSQIRDFTIEFWLYPLNMENGEQIFSWISTRPVNGNYSIQRISCVVSKNRLLWSFVNFFSSPAVAAAAGINIEFSGSTPVIPKTWSHHLFRFDASTGMAEYLVNNTSEAIVYTTLTGSENSEVFTPIAGNNGMFILGEHFMGIMDEFKIHNVCAGRSSIDKYASYGGRMETGIMDLGNNSTVQRLEASGGRTGSINEFRENGRFRFSDDSEMQFFIRACDNPYLIRDSLWSSSVPGQNITGIQGRYVQIAVDFYPSADGSASPYLDKLKLVYKPEELPLPPRDLTAVAMDGGVQLRWKHSPDANTAGYLVYYSSSRGDFFENDAVLGVSPIDAGYKNELFINGLKNGSLYYFRVSAYNSVKEPDKYNTGEFSREVTARPLAGLTNQTFD